MYTEVRQYLGNRADYTIDQAKLDVNRQYQRLMLSYQFHETEFVDSSISTVATVPTVTEPAGARVITGMRDTTNDCEVVPKDHHWLVEQDTVSTGPPEFFVRYEDGSVTLWPIPDAIYALKIWYKKAPDYMVADTDVPIYPADWHEIIVLLAASRAFFRYSLDAKAQNIKNEALSDIASIQEELTMDSRSRIGQVRVERTRGATS